MHNMDTENELQHKKSVTVTIRTNTSLKISALLAEICTTREVLIWQTGTFKVNILALSMRSCWLGRICRHVFSTPDGGIYTAKVPV